jgi:uncharacterized protein
MSIPHYPESRSIHLDDKRLFDALFRSLQPSVSEGTFANLFLFRHAHTYRLTRLKAAYVVLGRGYDGSEYFLPPLGGDTNETLSTLFDDGMVLCGCDERFVAGCLMGRKNIEIIEDRDAFDYLYLRQNLADLPGNQYHKKKNRINYFSARHEFTVSPLLPEHREGAFRLLEEWFRVRSEVESSSLRPEVDATAEALEMADRLGLEGVVILVEGMLRAFALGERLNHTTSVCHFLKADPFLDGLYQLADREFNRCCFTDCTYVNREQDLGEPNLRKSKLSYHPCELVKKFRAWRTPASHRTLLEETTILRLS